MLTAEQIDTFHEDGVLLIKSFFDLKQEIEPIQFAVYKIIQILITKYRLPIEQQAFTPQTFDSGYQELIAMNRRYGGEMYDAVKQIPAFLRLVASSRLESLMSQLRATDMPGVAACGYGIRIDNPGEERYRARWHQEYPAQFRSLDGVTFWSPLLQVTESLGPVNFCIGSHKEGLLSIRRNDPKNPEKTGAYGLILEREREIILNYPPVAPLTEPGDLVLIDFLVVHASGINQGIRSRWSMQLRYFNFLDPTGIQIGWCGASSSEVALEHVHPDLMAG